MFSSFGPVNDVWIRKSAVMVCILLYYYIIRTSSLFVTMLYNIYVYGVCIYRVPTFVIVAMASSTSVKVNLVLQLHLVLLLVLISVTSYTLLNTTVSPVATWSR